MKEQGSLEDSALDVGGWYVGVSYDLPSQEDETEDRNPSAAPSGTGGGGCFVGVGIVAISDFCVDPTCEIPEQKETSRIGKTCFPMKVMPFYWHMVFPLREILRNKNGLGVSSLNFPGSGVLIIKHKNSPTKSLQNLLSEFNRFQTANLGVPFG